MKTNVSKEEFENRATAYALGALSVHEARAFEDMLSSFDEEEFAGLKELDDVAALLAFDSISVAPPSSVKEKLFERINQETKEPVSVDVVTVRADEGEWIESGDGISVKQLFVDPFKKTVTILMRLQPGAIIPGHKHTGIEECYLVEGDITIRDEHYKTGDYLCAMPDTFHEPLSTVGGALLLLIAPANYQLACA
jgi:anti-sigma factor ChrR (cupin superfamily)